jgi:hypothetical protein
MSLSYRVSLEVKEVISADDKTIHQLELRDILPQEEMRDLLKDALIERGFEQGEGESLTREAASGEVTNVDLESLEVTTSLERSSEVSGKVDAWGDAETRSGAKNQAERSAQRQADAMVARGRSDAQSSVSQKLAEGEEERLEEMNNVLQGVYAEALKRKARRMGDVIEQHEGTNENGEYELVIKVEL